jgi:hypothetical protein
VRFNGRGYPDNPTVVPAQKRKGQPRGAVLIKDYKDYKQGKLLVSPKQSNRLSHRSRRGAVRAIAREGVQRTMTGRISFLI